MTLLIVVLNTTEICHLQFQKSTKLRYQKLCGYFKLKSLFIRISKRATQQNERNANFCKKDIVIIRAATWGHLYKLSSIISNKDGPSHFNNMSSYFHDCKRKVYV